MLALLLGVSIVLSDGRVLEGSDLRRQGASYQLTLASGEVVSLPEGLVREIRLTDDGPKPAPTAIRPAAPETLAGDADSRRPPSSQTLRRALGPPATFVEPKVDPSWQPAPAVDPERDVLAPQRSSFMPSLIDPNWTPESAFDAGIDVLASSRARFTPARVEPSWKARDGFGDAPASPVSKERFFSAAQAAPIPEADFAPDRCAATLLPGETALAEPRAAREDEPALEPLRLSLWRAERESDGRRVRIVFAADGDACRPLGGDLGGDKSAERALAAWVAAVGARRPLPATRDAKLALALALVTLTEPDASGARDASLKLLTDRDALATDSRQVPLRCASTPPERNRAARAALDAFRPPHVAGKPGAELATFFTWSPARGVVRRHAVTLPSDGVPQVVTEIVAEHVGAHDDDRPAGSPALRATTPETLAPKPAR
ncbi:MAG TPA: hypothetical protein VF139_14285 [Candidatus Polarisedimenticolaceae bacterium]